MDVTADPVLDDRCGRLARGRLRVLRRLPLPRPGAGAAAGEGGDVLGAIVAQALAVEAVDELAGDGVVEGDHVDDDLLPTEAAHVDPLQGGLEPVAEPGV